ncbi:MAG: glycosyltransferase [Microcoleaceae cyanobacterium]
MIALESKPETQIDGLISDKNLVVYAGTLEPYQGIDILIQGFQSVISADPKAFLLIVGGTKLQVEQYSNLAEECGIGDYCLFTGRVPQSLAQYYANQAKVQVSPRRSGTNTPLKVYQQLASGVPLVATNIYSHTQVLSDEVAFLVELNAEDMGHGILTALTDHQERQQRAQAAQKLYAEKYSREVYTEKMRSLLDFVMNS